MRLIKRNRFASPNPVKTDIRKGTPDVVDIYPGDNFSKILENYKGDVDIKLHGPGNMFNVGAGVVIITLFGNTGQKIRISGINNPVLNTKIYVWNYIEETADPALVVNSAPCSLIIENVIFEGKGYGCALEITCQGVTIKDCIFSFNKEKRLP